MNKNTTTIISCWILTVSQTRKWGWYMKVCLHLLPSSVWLWGFKTVTIDTSSIIPNGQKFYNAMSSSGFPLTANYSACWWHYLVCWPQIQSPSDSRHQHKMADKVKKSSIVGIVCDVHRHMEGHHYAEISSVFGLDQTEFDCLKNAGLQIKPSKYEKSKDRFQVRFFHFI